jgi:hypothetical protein
MIHQNTHHDIRTHFRALSSWNRALVMHLLSKAISASYRASSTHSIESCVCVVSRWPDDKTHWMLSTHDLNCDDTWKCDRTSQGGTCFPTCPCGNSCTLLGVDHSPDIIVEFLSPCVLGRFQLLQERNVLIQTQTDWLIGVYIVTHTFSVPTSSYKAIVQGLALVFLETKREGKKMLWLQYCTPPGQ